MCKHQRCTLQQCVGIRFSEINPIFVHNSTTIDEMNHFVHATFVLNFVTTAKLKTKALAALMNYYSETPTNTELNKANQMLDLVPESHVSDPRLSTMDIFGVN